MARILVVDDDPDILGLVRSVLTRSGHEVSVAEGGRQAAEIVRASMPDLLIIDVVMPDVGGIETILGLRREYPGLKTVVISGRIPVEQDSVQNLADPLGAECVLGKPFTPDALIDCVDRALLEPT